MLKGITELSGIETFYELAGTNKLVNVTQKCRNMILQPSSYYSKLY